MWALSTPSTQTSGLPLQICVTVLSSDGETDTVPLAITAASAAISLSGVPWPSPVAAVRVVAENSESLLLGPPASALESARFAALIAGTGERVSMLDAEVCILSG
jgi:polyribonucleotide nucleotidyltransferase